MSEQPVRAAAPAQRGQGRKILGMSQTQLLIVVGIALVGGAYLLYRARKAKTAAAGTAASATGSCADGSAPDANGNCPQSSQDFSGQLGTLQSEIAGLQAAGGAGGGGSSGDLGGGTGTTGTTGGSDGTAAGSTAGSTAAPPNANLPSGGQQVTRYPAPTGLTARADDSTTAAVSWNATTPPAQSYTVRFYQLNGKTAAQQTVGGVSSGRVSTAVTGLHPSWSYKVSVWANGGAQAPSGANTTVTMPKK